MAIGSSNIDEVLVSGSQALSGAGFSGARDMRPKEDFSFGELFKDAIGDVNKLEGEARTAANNLMTGADVDVHQAMIASQKATMAFEMVLAVRNKAVQSYQSVMSMQF